MADIQVAGPSPYTVRIDHGLDDQVAQRIVEIGARQALIVHQDPLTAAAKSLQQRLEDNGISATLAPIPDAEDGKSLAVAEKLWDTLGEKNFSRQDVVVGLGGGATTDLAGFVAATWMRGIKVVQVPTTLLAMVDAAVGGKTGINTAAGKNLVGAFHEPDSVFIDLARIDTLRAAAQQRRDSASQELTALRSQPAKAAGLPLELATLLCLGFALALEVVPALILCALRPAPVTETAHAPAPVRQKHAEERTQEHPETEPETPAGTALPAELLQLIARTESGAKLAVRQVAKELRMGSERTTRLMQQATEAGLLSKTAAGYVAA